MHLRLLFILIPFLLISCSTEDPKEGKSGGFTDGATTLFTKISAETSNINFRNKVEETMEFNFLNYPYLYAGAGVAVGDIDNDGLQDVYLVSNQGPSKLYKNTGNLTFQDITLSSKTEDFIGFSTGVTMLDINNDGWLDIYVSKAGSLDSDERRRNILFVNQKDGTFKEEAKRWGIDDPGYTTQVYQLDYDKDGDLDLFVLNYRYDFKNNTTISGEMQSRIEETTSDQLYRNDGARFTKVTGEAKIYNKAWGLGGAVGDFNNDGWDDIYVANDYLEPDILYINQQDGTFRDEIKQRMNHISFNSMGVDYADLNNDMLPDLVTVDMLAENYARSKENMASMSTANFENMVKVGYHHAYMANTLQINKGNGKFQETSQLSGIVKTDWSWAPLIVDLDNDGLKDIFISNGVVKDYTNQDFRKELRARNERGESMTLDAVLDLMPSEKLNNYVYKNNGDLSFTNTIEEWGMDDPSFSNGAVYADFDNDGDMDIMVSKANDVVGLYRNNSNKNYVQVTLKGPKENPLGIGAAVRLKNDEVEQLQNLYLARGYQSSVPNLIHFGLGDQPTINGLTVTWPDGKVSNIANPKANSNIEVDYATAIVAATEIKKSSLKSKVDIAQLGIDFEHEENQFNDYSLQLLLPQKQSTKGTGVVTADVNGDGLDDFFVGNSQNESAALFVQQNDGKFTRSNQNLWRSEAKYEDANALFFDADGDGDQDLFVVSAGYNLDKNSKLLQDRLYTNDGKGNFSKSASALPQMLTSGKAVVAGDYDKDGDLDLFVGGNVIPSEYPKPPRSYLLKNDGGKFTDATSANSSLAEIGMISEALFTDYDNDDDLDLLVVGEWMKPTIFNNNNGSFAKAENLSGFDKTEGWWFSATAGDFDGDGDEDYFFGNIGKNNKFQPKKDKPIYIYGKDFDENGSYDIALSKINDGKLVPVRGKECSSEQNPYLLDKIATYKEFAQLEFKDIYGEDKLKDAFRLTAHMFETVYAENKGNGTFEITKLQNTTQTGPTMSLVSTDVNKDGNLDVIGVGAIYDAEVETIRYDSNYGYVLLGDGSGNFSVSHDHDPFIDSDSKDIETITINGVDCFVVVSNNAPLEVFTFNP